MSEQSLLTGSVGYGAPNFYVDVSIVQTMLNGVPAGQGGPMPILVVDGVVGPATIGAISRFQLVNFGFSDGRIDPGQKSEQALVAILTLLGLLLKILANRPGSTPPPLPPIPQPKPPTKPVSPTGALTPIRAKFKAAMHKFLDDAKPGEKPPGAAPGSTGCGGFPGRLFRDVGVPKAFQPGDFVIRNVIGPGGVNIGDFRLSGHSIAWEYAAKAVDRDYPPAACWVPFEDGGRQPKCGDIYLQAFTNEKPFTGSYANKAPGYFAHVGVVYSLNGETFKTGDGGQPPGGFSSRFNTRRLFPDGRCETPDNEPGRRLVGWVDLDEIWAVYEKHRPKAEPMPEPTSALGQIGLNRRFGIAAM